MPSLVEAMSRDAELARFVREGFLAPRRAAVRVVLERGIDRGDLRGDLDIDLASAGTENASDILTMRSGGPRRHPSVAVGSDGSLAGSPSGIPASTQRAIVAICASVRRRLPSKGKSPPSTFQGGI